ncbi:MAG: nucleotidyl transferase AbiEii/AbiGii toxin family protein [Patescibacteria group bacterium]
MFEKVLPRDAKNSLALLGESGLLKDAYLAGGTALALHIGHRISVDFDFFTGKEFNHDYFVQKLTELPVSFQSERVEPGTIFGYLDKTKFSLFFYKYPLLVKTHQFLNLNISDIKDIASMKLAAISDRGMKRDFIDLYFIVVEEKLFTLEEVFGFYDRKFSILNQNKSHILKSLIYFDDADGQGMPQMLKQVSWTRVKKFFERETKYLIKKLSAI